MELLPNSKEFKILILSNAQFAPSGYGVQVNGMVYEWNKYYDTRVLANYGLQGRMLGLNNVQTYPTLPGDDHGSRTAELIFSVWKPDVFITLYDIWMGAYTRNTGQAIVPIHKRWIPILMIDHDPIPEGTATQCQNAFRCVVPLNYGVEQLAKYGIEATKIPLGIDTTLFKPTVDRKADKAWLAKRATSVNNQRQMPIEEDSFLILINGANKDPYRKGFMRMFTALQMFLDNNREARQKTRVYIHSWMRQARDLPHGLKVLGLDQYCKCTSDYHNLCGVPDDALARFYGAADVFFHLSEGGGFEIPVMEAMSSGVPVITTDFLCMHELVENRGWLIPPIREGKAVSKYFTPLDATQCIANEEKAADALEDAYQHPEKRQKYAELGRAHALQFDWTKVNPLWIELFEEIRQSMTSKSLLERQL